MGLDTSRMTVEELNATIDKALGSEERATQFDVPVIMDGVSYDYSDGRIELTDKSELKTGYLRFTLIKDSRMFVGRVLRSYDGRYWHRFAMCGTKWLGHRTSDEGVLQHAIHQMIEQHSAWTTPGSRYKPRKSEALNSGRKVEWRV